MKSPSGTARAAFLFLALLALPAHSGTEDSELNKKLQDLETRLNAFSEQTQNNTQNALPADFSIRLTRIENGIRQITGQVEESQYAERQARLKNQNEIADLKLRISKIEETLSQLSANPQDTQNTNALNPTLEAPPDNPDQLYSFAVNLLLAQKDYEAAQNALDLFLAQYPDHPKAGPIYYWIGELHSLQNEHKDAAQAYLEGYSSYPESPKAVDSLLKLAMSLAELGETRQSCSTLDELRTRFPRAPQRITRRADLERSRAQCS